MSQSRAPLVPGNDLQNDGKYTKQCERCHGGILMARVAGTINGVRGVRWTAFDSRAIEQPNGTLMFRVHWCPLPPPIPPSRRRSPPPYRGRQRRLL